MGPRMYYMIYDMGARVCYMKYSMWGRDVLYDILYGGKCCTIWYTI